jgi:hypothetical protein
MYYFHYDAVHSCKYSENRLFCPRRVKIAADRDKIALE